MAERNLMFMQKVNKDADLGNIEESSGIVMRKFARSELPSNKILPNGLRS
jgi:hypothetical protein